MIVSSAYTLTGSGVRVGILTVGEGVWQFPLQIGVLDFSMIPAVAVVLGYLVVIATEIISTEGLGKFIRERISEYPEARLFFRYD